LLSLSLGVHGVRFLLPFPSLRRPRVVFFFLLGENHSSPAWSDGSSFPSPLLRTMKETLFLPFKRGRKVTPISLYDKDYVVPLF